MTGSKSGRIVIQERDRQLLRELTGMSVVDREQAKCVAGFRSTTRVNHRLLVLTQAGLLRRFFLGTSAGGMKAVYALSEKGAKLVDVPLRGPRRRSEEVLVADFFVNHQLAVNQIYCHLRCGVSRTDVRFQRWVNFFEPLSPGSALIPDGYLEAASPARVLAAFVEVDLGHESRSIWAAKVRKYLDYAVSGDFKKRFSLPQFRVLVIANSERRLQSIRAVTASITEKLFWFTTQETINRESLWLPIWLRPVGDLRQSLL